MAIHNWSVNDRPRERLIDCGANQLSDAELLAILLRTGTQQKSAVALSRELLAKAGGLRKLLGLSFSDFVGLHGVGPAKYSQVQAALELSKRALLETMRRDVMLGGSQETVDFLTLQLRDRPYEVFSAIFLDTRHQVIVYRELFRGTINGANVPPREVVKESLKYNAASLIVAHNHPSGVADPSPADINLTERLSQALALVDVRLLDHIIVGEELCVSFAERGLMP